MKLLMQFSPSALGHELSYIQIFCSKPRSLQKKKKETTLDLGFV